jgi:hypothetical protein
MSSIDTPGASTSTAFSASTIFCATEGTEFSIDGWINGDKFCAKVQHKLFMVQSTFIGDGPTVSPPIQTHQLPEGMARAEE